MNAKQLVELANFQFARREGLMSLWQEIAENFYPERADFTYQRTMGTDFAAGMMTSYPFLCRRDLGDQIGQMLRPTNKSYAHMAPMHDDELDTDGKAWCEWAENTQRKAMYDRVTQFTRTMHAGDHDYATFGQHVYSVEMNYRDMALLYRSHHLRDVTWAENSFGEVGAVFRRWKPQYRDLLQLYPLTVHEQAKQIAIKQPFEQCECLHMVVEADMYDGELVDPRQDPRLYGVPRRGALVQPRVLICYDVTHDKVLEAIGIWGKHYIVERWTKPGHTQFAYSPATIAALADGRLIQAMTLTLLEAGEKVTNPPMIATELAVRSDVDIAPGGITWVDIEYDERLGGALRPLTIDSKGMPLSVDMQRDSRDMISRAFYLNKIAPPLISKDPRMTAFQAGQIIQQWIREALPLFEPMEHERNGQLFEETFWLLMRNGTFGDPRNMPKSLRGMHLDWKFESPLHDVIEQQKGQKFLEMKQLLSEAVALDPSTANLPDTMTALRDALEGIGIPAKWQHSQTEIEAAMRRQSEQQAAQALLERMKTGSETAANLAAANKDNATANVA